MVVATLLLEILLYQLHDYLYCEKYLQAHIIPVLSNLEVPYDADDMMVLNNSVTEMQTLLLKTRLVKLQGLHEYAVLDCEENIVVQ